MTTPTGWTRPRPLVRLSSPLVGHDHAHWLAMDTPTSVTTPTGETTPTGSGLIPQTSQARKLTKKKVKIKIKKASPLGTRVCGDVQLVARMGGRNETHHLILTLIFCIYNNKLTAFARPLPPPPLPPLLPPPLPPPPLPPLLPTTNGHGSNPAGSDKPLTRTTTIIFTRETKILHHHHHPPLYLAPPTR